MKPLGIFGTSGWAREVADVAEALGFTPFFVARDASEATGVPPGFRVILEGEVETGTAAPFAIGIGDNKVREKVAHRFEGKLHFPPLLHPSATFGIGSRAVVEAQPGVVVCAGVRMTNNLRIGKFCVFNLNATIGHDVVVEDFVNISPGAHISGYVHIGARSWIGTGATINQGDAHEHLRIGADTMIGSGAAVVRSCDSGAVYVGVPAKRIK
jgi:sugar O-acyltransferase (sialic acid O-acetyltransferase NeuD family)